MVLKLRHKIVILAVVSALLPVVIMTGLTFLQKKNLQRLMENKIDALTIDNLKSTALDFYKTCDIANKIMVEQIFRNIEIAADRFNSEGGLSLSPTQKITWHAVNQYTKDGVEVGLPAMMIGGKPIMPNTDFARPSPVIDKLKKLTGGTYTIFERMNEKGDMLRIATNVPKADGQRAIGTFIPATDPDGKPNRVIETLMRGETYKGSAFVVDSLYITAYEPVKDAKDQIIGCIYSGVKINAMTMVKELMKNERIGKSGYIAVLGGSGESKGKYIVSLNNTREGESILDSKDANGKYFIRDMINTATASPGTISYMDYPWLNPGVDKVARHKKASCIYFAPWDWVIIPSMYMDDFNDMYDEVSGSINGLLRSIVIGGIAFLLIAAVLAWYMGNRISRPVAQISEIAGSIANGDLSGAITGFKAISRAVSGNGEIDEKLLAKDETGSLIRSIVMMTKNLNSLVGEVQKATIHLVSTATEIAASSREQEVTVNELGASTNEIVSSTKEISSTSQQLVNTMNEVAEASNNAAGLAEAGKSGLNNMEKSMEQLASATASISSKLSIINEKTSNINNVVATITKVADQTNLLSLNASIEAEKAGEYGKGFAVVAREIRRLADQTAIATLDIIKMVREMQSAVSAGVMGMDKFSEDVRQSVKETELISGQIEGIIMEVQSLPTKFDMVIDGMKQQTIGAQQISDSMTQLSECTRTTSDSLRAFNEVAVQLNNATLNLQKEVAIFKVK